MNLNEESLQFSKQLESIRKDVECTFGILKKRFNILKNTMNYHSKEKIDNIVFTCSILHNMILHFDNYDEKWLDLLLEDTITNSTNANVNFIQNLLSNILTINNNLPDYFYLNEIIQQEDSHFTLQNQLITNFGKLKLQNQIQWLK